MADTLARAYEISRPAVEELSRRRQGRVLSVFAHACNLLLDETHVVTLLGPGSEVGPFHVALEAGAPFDRWIVAGDMVRCERESVRVGSVLVDWSAARIFEPRPDWERHRRDGAVQGQAAMEYLRSLARRHAPRDSLMELFEGIHADLELVPAPSRADCPGGESQDQFPPAGPAWPGSTRSPSKAGVKAEPDGAAFPADPRRNSSRVLLIAAVRRSAETLRAAARAGDAAAIADSAQALAGLGPGATPAGDDFLAGAMLRAHLSDPHAEAFCAAVLEAAAPLTVPLSAAFLRASAAGECSRAWHRLLAALVAPGQAGLEQATLALLSQGASSGADALAGWLFF